MDSRILYIAGIRVEIKFHDIEFNSIKKIFIKHIDNYYKDFILEYSDIESDFTIEFVWNNEVEIVERKKEKKYYEELYKVSSVSSFCTYYQISFMQFATILKHALYAILQNHQGYILHGSAALINGGVYIFTGNSGAGKSTAVKLLSQNFIPLADDIVILRKENEKWYFYQTPFIEKNNIQKKSHEPYPLRRVCFLKKSNDFKLTRIRNKIHLLVLLQSQHFSLYKSSSDVGMINMFINQFSNFNYLYFANDEEKFAQFIKNYEKI